MNKTLYLSNVSPLSHEVAVMGGRLATLLAESDDNMRKLFGTETGHGDGDKVTIEWHFKTPRGVVEVRDYWWNNKGEYSITAPPNKAGSKAALWMIKYFRAHGLKAFT